MSFHLENKGKTIAVLGTGLDSVYPLAHQQMAQDILANQGCLLSEYEWGTPINKFQFVQRDRLISGLSQVLIVIETGLKGGTMQTITQAQKQKKPIACVSSHPPSYWARDSLKGNQQILGQGLATALKNKADLSRFVAQSISSELFHK